MPMCHIGTHVQMQSRGRLPGWVQSHLNGTVLTEAHTCNPGDSVGLGRRVTTLKSVWAT